MKALVLSVALVCGNAFGIERLPMTEGDAMKAVAAGMCGTLGLGTGLVDGKGWLHQPIPGPVQLRLTGSGTITTVGKPPEETLVLDMFAGKPYYVIVNAPASSKLEWKVPGYAWGPVPIGFQLPPIGAVAR